MVKLFELLARPPLGRRTVPLLVESGRVWCPQRGDIEVGQCRGCPSFVAYDGRELRCRTERRWLVRDAR
jgi:hypothetical protein